MLDVIKGNPEDLEGKAIIFATDINAKPFIFESMRGPAYPFLQIHVVKEASYILKQSHPRTLSENRLNTLISSSPCDLIRVKSQGISGQFILDELNCASIYYRDLFMQQDQRVLGLTKAYGVEDPLKLTPETKKDLITKVVIRIKNDLINNKDYSKPIIDLQYLTQGSYLKREAAQMGALLFHDHSKSQPITLEELSEVKEKLLLYAQKIEAILNERFEEAAELKRKLEKKA